MKIRIAISLFLGISFLNASHDLYNPEFIEWCNQTKDAAPQPYNPIISLGINCQVAYQLRIHGLRYEAYPFDWIICPFEALIQLLENKFEDFLAPEYLVFIHTEKDKHILHTKYGIKFLHDFKLVPHFMNDYEKVKTTYDRRIKRFYQKLSEPCRALLIRRKITKKQAIQLKQVLQQQFPQANFLIQAIDNSEEIKVDWDLEMIKNYYMPVGSEQTWKGNTILWTELFMQLGLNITLEEPQDVLFT